MARQTGGSSLKVGQLIWLKKFGDQPRQRGRVLEVLKKFRDDEAVDFKRGVVTDDGLREVPEDQVEPAAKVKTAVVRKTKVASLTVPTQQVETEMTKDELMTRGLIRLHDFCRLNNLTPPWVEVHAGRPRGKHCAYYKKGEIHIWPAACSSLGMAGRSWSYPGYTVDRTPFGVLAHELGHHVNKRRGAFDGWMKATGEAPITNYCPNATEWFAEMFKVFVTNPDLLLRLRPKTYARMRECWQPVETRPWDTILASVDRQRRAAAHKIANLA